MHPFINASQSRRLFQWEELDVLRTVGYNIDCSTSDFVDTNPDDNPTFDCDFDDHDCAIASVSDTRNNLESCGESGALLMIPTCPGENTESISVQALHSLLTMNDPNANGIAFIKPLYGGTTDFFERVSDNYLFTTRSWNNFIFSYALIGCNGSIGNTSIFSITTFPEEDCENLALCEPSDCEDFIFPEEWPPCVIYDDDEINLCNLVCNGEFSGSIAGRENLLPVPSQFPPLVQFGTHTTPWHEVTNARFASPHSWIKGSGSVDYMVPGATTEESPSVGLFYTPSSFISGLEYIEGVYTFLNTSPQLNKNYLFSANFINYRISLDPPTEILGLEVRLIQGQEYNLCDIDDMNRQFCYEPTASSQVILEPTTVLLSPPGEGGVRGGNCFTSQDDFNSILIETTDIGVGEYFQIIDNVELIPDNFHTGGDIESQFCGTPQTLGGEVFCMLSDLHVQYNWLEAGSDTPIHTYDVLNGTVNGNPSFQVAPQQTTTYRLERTILDLGGLPEDFEFCTTSDEVTITVIEQFPIADFTFQAVDGECGTFSFTSDPTTVGNIHTWYLNEITEDAIFSMEVNPAGYDFPNGVNTVIHVVEGRCGTDEFELTLPVVDCEQVNAACLCEGQDAINIDAGEGTLLSELIAAGEMPANGISNNCLSITGHLQIDQMATTNVNPYLFTASEVRMLPGSKITVEAEAALSIVSTKDGIGVHGCEALWDGIYLSPSETVQSGGKLFLQDAKIEDAIYAVKLSHQTTLGMAGTTLNRNHIGIYAAPSETIRQRVHQPAFVRSSTISSTEALLPMYPGQEIQTGYISHAGIEINNCSNFQIGGGGLGVSISNSRHGVITRGAHVKVYNSSIHNIIEDPFDDFGNSGTGIFSEDNSWTTAINNRIYNTEDGIFIANSSILALGNTIGETPNGERGNVSQGISFFGGIGHRADIYKANKIYTTLRGIRLSNTEQTNRVIVKDNLVELFPLPSQSPFQQQTAICAIEGLASTGENDGYKSIDENIVNIHVRGTGIEFLSANSYILSNNEVNFLSPTDAQGRGINCYLSSNNYINSNIVSAANSSNAIRGMEIIEGDNNVICCNTVEKTGYGIYFRGNCEGTKLRHSNFIENDYSLLCGQNTRIGQQSAGGNMWDNNSSVQAAHLSSNQFDINSSRFRVLEPSGTSIWPGTIEVLPGITNWFVSGQSAMLCEEDDASCQIPQLNQLAANPDYAESLLAGNFYYGAYPETSEWEAKTAFYRSQKATKTQAQAIWTDESHAFFDQQQQTKSPLFSLNSIEYAILEEIAHNTSSSHYGYLDHS